MKLRLAVLSTSLLIAAVASSAASNSILYQLPSVAATPVCNAGDIGCLGGVIGYTYAGEARARIAHRAIPAMALSR